jgi:hypothetical protein
MAESALAAELASRPGSERFKVLIHLGADGLAETERGTPVPGEVLERLLCDCDIEVVADPSDQQTDSIAKPTADENDKPDKSPAPNLRPIPARTRKLIEARDRRCTFPGCPNTIYTELHHIKPRRLGGDNSPGNVLKLCSAHHAKVHALGFAITQDSPGSFTFRHPGGLVLRPANISAQGCPSIQQANQEAGLQIGPRTATTQWDGGKMSYDDAMWLLFERRERAGWKANWQMQADAQLGSEWLAEAQLGAERRE